MPLFGTFSSASSRALGLRNGSPPLPPTISAPSDNVSASLTGSGNTTNRINTTVSFTSTVTSFAIASFEFKVDQLDSSDNIVVAGTYQTAASAGATSFLLSNLLTSTRYGLYMRTVDVAGLVSAPTSVVRFITAAEVAPTVPEPSPSSTALGVSFAYSGGTAGTYAIGTREYSLHLTGSTPSYVPFTGTVYDRRTTTNASGAALVPKTSYTVTFRYTASSPTTLPGSTNSKSISTASEVKNSAPTVTINTQTTTNVTFTRGTSSGGTYGVSYYEYVIHNSSGGAVRTGTMSTATTSLNISAGVDPNATFTVYVRAISLTSDLAGDYGSAAGQLDPNTPSAPTLYFSSTNASERANAYLAWDAQTYATTYHVYRNGGYYAATSGTSMTVGGHSAGTAYYYQVYTGNRLGNFSGSSNTKYMSTGNNVDWEQTVSTAKYIQNYGDCVVGDSISSLVIQAPSSASSSGDAGYYYINTIKFEALKTTGGFNYSVGDSGARPLYFHKTSGASPSVAGWGAGYHSISKFPLSTTTGYFYEWGVYQGGADISSVVFKVTTTVAFGNGWGAYNSGCSPSTALSITGRNITLTGYRMTSTTYG